MPLSTPLRGYRRRGLSLRLRAVDLAGRHLYAIDTPLPTRPRSIPWATGRISASARCASGDLQSIDPVCSMRRWCRKTGITGSVSRCRGEIQAVDAPAFIVRRQPPACQAWRAAISPSPGLPWPSTSPESSSCPLPRYASARHVEAAPRGVRTRGRRAAGEQASRAVGRHGPPVLRTRLAPTAYWELRARVSETIGSDEHSQKVAEVYRRIDSGRVHPSGRRCSAVLLNRRRWVWQASLRLTHSIWHLPRTAGQEGPPTLS
jgi:hypothetical protein